MKTIGFSRLGAPADSPFCNWPSCNAHSPDYPICRRHRLKVYQEVSAEIEHIKTGVMNVDALPETRQPSVYFVRYRDRVKIGYSIDPMTRIKAHPFDEILAIVPGDRTAEKQAHAAFAHLRENGEWFRAEDDLLEFARGIAN